MNNDLAIINIIQRANTDIEKAIKETNQKQYISARDNLIKSYTLLDLISSINIKLSVSFSISTNENNIHNHQIEQLIVIQKMISNLITDLENKSNSIINTNNKAEDKGIIIKQDNNKLSPLPNINMNFQEIIGSTEAKQGNLQNKKVNKNYIINFFSYIYIYILLSI
jgi:hypothetical protein